MLKQANDIFQDIVFIAYVFNVKCKEDWMCLKKSFVNVYVINTD